MVSNPAMISFPCRGLPWHATTDIALERLRIFTNFFGPLFLNFLISKSSLTLVLIALNLIPANLSILFLRGEEEARIIFLFFE